jgi:large conductance mechanosensitive channel
MPLLGAIGGKVSFDQYYVVLNRSEIKLGTFFTALVYFLIVAAVIFFFVLKPINALMALRARHNEPPAEATTHECPYCLSEIPLKASRCRYCTADVAPVPVTVGAQGRVTES